MSTQSELLACPFCGGDATLEKVQVHSFDIVRYSVGCKEQDGKALCQGYQSLTTFARQADAIKAWNTRAADAKSAVPEPVRDAQGGRQCSCHPDDNPPVPCAQKYAYSECATNAPALLSGEPVAYRWRYPSRDQWHLQSYPPNPPCGADGIEVQKLYALPAAQCAPQPSGEPEGGLLDGQYPLPVEHYQREARNLANLWSNGNDGARTCILSALLKAAAPVAVSCAAREALERAQEAIATLPMDALGYGEDDAGRWPLRDELLQQIHNALSLPAAGGEASKCEAEWQPVEVAPEVGRKFICLWNDGSGCVMYWRHDHGYIDQDGDEVNAIDWSKIERWAYLPDDFEFWCENGEEGMVFTTSSTPIPDDGRTGEPRS